MGSARLWPRCTETSIAWPHSPGHTHLGVLCVCVCPCIIEAPLSPLVSWKLSSQANKSRYILFHVLLLLFFSCSWFSRALTPSIRVLHPNHFKPQGNMPAIYADTMPPPPSSSRCNFLIPHFLIYKPFFRPFYHIKFLRAIHTHHTRQIRPGQSWLSCLSWQRWNNR